MIFKQRLLHFLFVVPPLFAFLSFKVTSSNTSTTTSKNSGFSLDIIHLDNKHYEFYNRNLSDEERYQRLHDISDSRVKLLGKNTSIGTTTTTTTTRGLLQLRPTVTRNPSGLLYRVKISIGTPSLTYYLALDTGSSLTWTHCHPLQNHFNLKEPIFLPQYSSTYRLIPCTHRLCKRPDFTCINNFCIYSISYADGSITKGILSQETINFGEYSSSSSSVPNFAFGCSHYSNDKLTGFSGIFGMGSGPVSFPRQLQFGKFSYCLPKSNNKISYLRFDNDIPRPPRGHSVSSTQLLMSGTHGYQVQLLGISINGRRLPIPTELFQFVHGRQGCYVDSGASFTYLIRPAYEILKEEIVRYFDMHLLVRATDDMRARSRMDVCYLWDPSFVHWPEMVFHFQDADLSLHSSQTYVAPPNLPIFCLAIKTVDHLTLIGSYQQRDRRFVYNLVGRRLEFFDEDCDSDSIHG